MTRSPVRGVDPDYRPFARAGEAAVERDCLPELAVEGEVLAHVRRRTARHAPQRALIAQELDRGR